MFCATVAVNEYTIRQ